MLHASFIVFIVAWQVCDVLTFLHAIPILFHAISTFNKYYVIIDVWYVEMCTHCITIHLWYAKISVFVVFPSLVFFRISIYISYANKFMWFIDVIYI